MWAVSGLYLLLLAASFQFGQCVRREKYIEDTDRFPGWKGELPTKDNLEGRGSVGFGLLGKEVWRGDIEQLSWKPRAFLLKGFLSEEETDYLINKATPYMTKSTVVDNDSGKSIPSNVRTSTGTFFSRGQDETISRIEDRLALVSMLPKEHGEGLQILHYRDGEKYEPHNDYFHDDINPRPENGGQRIATVLMYLTTPEEGGETVFPNADRKVTGPGWSDCAKRGLAVKAKKGDAIMFYSLDPSGKPDPASLHGSCPTTKGEKWSATKWLHVLPFGHDSKYQKAKWGDCVDSNPKCEEWAVYGECQKNAGYMNTYCRKSCDACGGKSN